MMRLLCASTEALYSQLEIYLCGNSVLGDSKFIFCVYGGTADEHLEESLLMLLAAFSLLSLRFDEWKCDYSMKEM